MNVVPVEGAHVRPIRRVIWITGWIVTGSCLILAAITTALWVRSYFVCDSIRIGFGKQAHGCRGEVFVHIYRVRFREGGFDPAFDAFDLRLESKPLPQAVDRAECVWLPLIDIRDEQTSPFPRSWTADLLVQHFYLVMLFVSPALVWLAAARSRRWWAAPGKCPTCGYDLRGTPDRCPECGTVVLALKTRETRGTHGT